MTFSKYQLSRLLKIVISILTLLCQFLPHSAEVEVAHNKNLRFESVLVALLQTTQFAQCSLLIIQDEQFSQVDIISQFLNKLSEEKSETDIFSIKFNFERNKSTHFLSFPDYKKSKAYCSLVVNFLEHRDKWERFYQKVAIDLTGLVKKDEDYFVFVMDKQTSLRNLLANAKIRSKIKYQIGLSLSPFVGLIKVCFHCKAHSNLMFDEIFWNGNDKNGATTLLVKALLFNSIHNMRGKVLRVSTPLSTRWLNEMVQTHEGKWIARRGLYKLVLNVLESKLNFSSHHLPSTGGGTGAIVNGSWVGTVGDVLYDRADLGHVTAETWTRFLVVAHSFPISHEWLTFSTGLPNEYFSWRAVYRPLGLNVWLFVGISILGVGLFLYIIVSIQVSHLRVRRTWIFGVLAKYLIGTILEQNPTRLDALLKTKYHLKHFEALRVFTIFWLLYNVLISTAYRSKLVTFLVFPNVDEPPATFEELAHSQFQIGLQYIKGAAYEVFKRSKNPTYAKIFIRMSLEESDVGCFLSAVKSKFACISWDSIAEFVKHRNLTDKYGKSPVLKSPSSTLSTNAGLVMEKRAVFLKDIDHILRWITDTGILIQMRILDFNFVRSQRNDWLKSTGQQRTDYGSNKDKGVDALNLSHFSGSFYLFACCTFFSTLCFFMEAILVFRVKRKKLQWSRDFCQVDKSFIS